VRPPPGGPDVCHHRRRAATRTGTFGCGPVSAEGIPPPVLAELVLRALRRAFLASLRATAGDLAAAVPGLCVKLGVSGEPARGGGPLAEPALDNVAWYAGALRGRSLPQQQQLLLPSADGVAATPAAESSDAAGALARALVPTAPAGWGWGPRFAGYEEHGSEPRVRTAPRRACPAPGQILWW
jgi:hypothetical protein